MQPFKPSNKHLLMTREFYKELKSDLERIKTALDTNDARQYADHILQKLRDKYEAPEYDIKRALTSHTVTQQEWDDPRFAPRKPAPGIVKLDENGNEVL